MVELAIVIPVLTTLFLGSWTAADLIADNNAANQATRAGARYGAEMGNDGYDTGDSTSPYATDMKIINQMMPIVNGKLTNGTLKEIDIYQPSACTNSGAYNGVTCPPNNGAYTAGNLIDVYTYSNGTWTAGTQTYLLSNRSEIHPNESELGVRLVFQYTSPTLRFFTQQVTQYSVMRLAPQQ